MLNLTSVILRNINPQSELFSSSDVEAQTVVIRCGEEMYDPAESAVWTGLWRCTAALLHHHPSVNQIHPTHTYIKEDILYCICTTFALFFPLSCGLRHLSVNQIVINVTAVIYSLLLHETKIQYIPKRKITSVSDNLLTRSHKTTSMQRSVVVTGQWST